MKWLNYKDSSIDTIESVEHRLQITLPDDSSKFKRGGNQYNYSSQQHHHFDLQLSLYC